MTSLKISWSPAAEESYIRVVDFILKNWSVKEVKKFNDITSLTIAVIAKNPELFIASKERKDVRKGFITKHTSLLYKIKSNEIELIYFWDNRRNPKKMKA